MPFIQVNVGKPMSDEQKDTLQREIMENVTLLPGKNRVNTVISIADNCAIYNDGARMETAFIDIRLNKESPFDAKKAFAQKLFAIMHGQLQIEAERLYINYVELPLWASGGNLF